MQPETSISIRSKDELKDVLKMSGVLVDQWDSFKGLNELWEEVKSGETLLIQSGKEVTRQVRFARIYVFFEDNGQKLQLFEAKQVRNNGETRERGFDYVAEKLKKSDQNPEGAALRGIKEELGIEADTAALTSNDVKTESRPSPSYPGLNSEYKIHVFSLHLDDGQFNPDGYVEDDGKKKTYFEWRAVT